MTMLSSLYRDMKSDFWGTLALLQSRRGIWLLFAATALAMEIFSWAFFQNFLELKPCELCVYIRFAMIAICLGALVAAIRPASLPFRLGGYIITFWWTIQGFLWCLRLRHENIMSSDPDWISPCGALPSFPFGLELHKWFPSHFMPMTTCGKDSSWSLLGLSMPEWLLMVYACFAAALLLMLFAWIKQGLGSKKM